MSRKQIAVAAVAGPVGTGALIAKIATAAGVGSGWAIGLAALVIAAGALVFLVLVLGLGFVEDVIGLLIFLAIPLGAAIAAALRWDALPWWAWALIFTAGAASIAFLVVSGRVAAAFARAGRV